MTTQSYTTGEVARICGVTKRTVILWIDGGRLAGYRIPGSKHRRVAARELEEFMKRHGIPGHEPLAPHRRILIVDDDADFVALLRDTLRSQYVVDTAGSAMEAAARLPVFQPDLILVDIRLPDLNGMEVCRHIVRSRGDRKAAVMAMSAYGSDIDLQQVRSSGADDFIAKPVKLADLRRRIRSMVG